MIFISFRYRLNQLFFINAPKPEPSARHGSYFTRILSSLTKTFDVRSAPVNTDSSNENGYVHIDSTNTQKMYLFEKLIFKGDRSKIWDNIDFWEDVFYDAVYQEREMMGK